MKIQIAFLAASITFMNLGCQTSPVQKKGSELISPIVGENFKYTKGSTAMSTRTETHSMFSKCPTSSESKWKSGDWKAVVDLANVCIQRKSWEMVQVAAAHLMENESQGPWGFYFMSLYHEAKGNLPKSLWMTDLAHKKSPSLGIASYQKGRILWKMGEKKAAVKEIESALKLDAKLVDANLFLGQIYAQENAWALAREHFDAVLKLEAQNFDALFGSAIVKIELKDGAGSVENLLRAATLQPDNAAVKLALAQAYETLEKDPEKALGVYRELDLLLQKQKSIKIGLDVKAKIKAIEGLVLAQKPAPKVTRRDPASDSKEVRP